MKNSLNRLIVIGYRTFLYDRIARKWPETFIEINNGVGFDGGSPGYDRQGMVLP